MEKFGDFESRQSNGYYAVIGDTVRFATPMHYDDPSWGNMCSGTAVIDVQSLEIDGSDVSIDHSHAPDMAALAAAERVLEAYSAQDDDYRDNAVYQELWEIAEKVSQRTGIQVVGVHHNRGYDTQVSDDLEHADYILFCASGDYHGREFAAMCNGYRWSVYDVPKERVEQWINDDWGTIDDFDFVGFATDSCHGYTWGDIDCSGYSNPDYDDLVDAL